MTKDNKANRIMIFGGAGSGKSTLARKLGTITRLPVIHIDRLYWKPGWVMRPREEIGLLTNAEADKERWIFEGNHSETMPYRASRADMVVFLDMSTPRRLWRVIGRILKHRGRTRPDMADDCLERFDWDFLKWVANYRKDGRLRALRFIDTLPPALPVHHLRTPKEVDAFLNGMREKVTAGRL